MCCYLISTASLMDNGCLGIQGLQFAKASLQKAPLSKSLACKVCFLLANQEPPHHAQETVTLTGLVQGKNKLKKQKPTPSLARRISKPCMPVGEVLPLCACWYARNHTLTITSDLHVISCIVSTDITFNNIYIYTLRERNSNSKYAQLNVYIYHFNQIPIITIIKISSTITWQVLFIGNIIVFNSIIFWIKTCKNAK